MRPCSLRARSRPRHPRRAQRADRAAAGSRGARLSPAHLRLRRVRGAGRPPRLRRLVGRRPGRAPARASADRARDLLELAGREALIARVKALLAAGEARRALHLAGILRDADRSDRAGQELFAEALSARFAEEPSFIARSFDRAAADEAEEAAKGGGQKG